MYPRREIDGNGEGSSILTLYDDCMGSVHNVSKNYFYNTPSNCLADLSSVTWTGEYNKSDINETLRAAWSGKDKKAIGIGKDGRIIYSPTYSSGTVYSPCQLDICNGMMYAGKYAYTSTFFHPYIMGCYGPGSTPDMPEYK